MKLSITILLAVLLVAAAPAAAGDLQAGRELAVKCKQCHGFDGIGKLPNFPNIAGQKEIYLVSQLQAYKTGIRQNDMMTFAVEALSDQDIADLAAYYAAIEVEVTVPE